MKKIVVIGGGSGLFSVLRGLKTYPCDISAIVTMYDSGGSSGMLRDEHGILPPGDVRRCLLALADDSEEETLRKLFNYRFKTGESLKGHSFGNILLTALTETLGREDKAIEAAGKLLNINGQVIPVTLEKAHLCAVLEDGAVIEGETNIDLPKHDGALRIKEVYLKPHVSAYEKAVKALREADVIIFGPGDIYTSIIPNLLTKGISEAIQKSTAKKIFILNLFTKWGETHNYKASDCARSVLSYAGLDSFDTIIYNTGKMRNVLLSKYEEEKKYPIEIDKMLDAYANEIIGEDIFHGEDVYRHDSKKIAKTISDIL